MDKLSSFSEAGKIHKEYCEKLQEIVIDLSSYSFLREKLEVLNNISSSAVEPFNVAVFGRMKTGKSSLINALIGRDLALTGVEETTATINRLTYGDGEQLKNFTVHWKYEAASESFPVEELQSKWTGTEQEVLERVKKTAWLDLYSNAVALRDIHIIDTPGTGSIAIEHEDIAQQFIKGQEADALVYVFSPVGRETDEDALRSFRKGCLSGSSPDNSVAILHKWDHIYWANGGDWEDICDKARRLHHVMDSVVAKVLPVSAPLALIAKIAPDSFWTNAFAVLGTFEKEEELVKTLNRDTKWDREPIRQALRKQAVENGLPWASFQVLLRELYRTHSASQQEARQRILKLSGMPDFENLLDRQFFKRKAIIRRRQIRAKAQRVLQEIYIQIGQTMKDWQEDLVMMDRIAKEVSNCDLVAWVERKRYSLKNDNDNLRKQWEKIDETVIKIGEKSDEDENIPELIRWLDTASAFFNPEERIFLKKVLNFLGNSIKSEDIMSSNPILKPIFNKTAELCNRPDRNIRRYAEKLRDCLYRAVQ